MKVIAWWVSSVTISNGKITDRVEETLTFGSLDEASKFFRVSEKRILNCIKTGRKWRGVTYDEGI